MAFKDYVDSICKQFKLRNYEYVEHDDGYVLDLIIHTSINSDGFIIPLLKSFKHSSIIDTVEVTTKTSYTDETFYITINFKKPSDKKSTTQTEEKLLKSPNVEGKDILFKLTEYLDTNFTVDVKFLQLPAIMKRTRYAIAITGNFVNIEEEFNKVKKFLEDTWNFDYIGGNTAKNTLNFLVGYNK